MAEIKCNFSFHIIQNSESLLERELYLLQLTQAKLALKQEPLWMLCWITVRFLHKDAVDLSLGSAILTYLGSPRKHRGSQHSGWLE